MQYSDVINDEQKIGEAFNEKLQAQQWEKENGAKIRDHDLIVVEDGADIGGICPMIKINIGTFLKKYNFKVSGKKVDRITENYMKLS